MKEFNINQDNVLVSYHGPSGHVRVPDGVKAIGGGAFTFVDALTIFQVVLPEGLETVGFRAFEGCALLTHVYLPSTLKTIEHSAFAGCTSLEKINFPQGLEEIGEKAFYYCEKLESPVFPDTLKVIGDCAFHTCYALTEITLPESLEVLGDAAFARCTNLKQVTTSARLKTLPIWCFRDCFDLEQVSLPDGLETIEGGVFDSCGNLKEVNIPSSVHTIGGRAFADCISLPSAMALPAGLKKLGIDLFAGSSVQCFSMPEEVVASFSYRNFPGGNAGLAVQTADSWRFYGFSAKSNRDVLTDYVRRGKWNSYDLQLLNNGPEYKFKTPARLLASLGRLVDPVDLTDECRELHLEFLIKNAKKLIPIAEQLRCPAIVEAMKEHGIINDKNKKAIAKLLAASIVPEIASVQL